jgi:zinc finger FYVE domain-containing protein 26
MMEVLPYSEQIQHWELMGQPHLIVEQFIMNTRLEMLEKMLSEVHPLLTQLAATAAMSVTNIDNMLRHYASKALDFRVVQCPASCRTVPAEEKLLVSLSLGSTHSEDFLMPAAVPTKDEWVRNDEVLFCFFLTEVGLNLLEF